MSLFNALKEPVFYKDDSQAEKELEIIKETLEKHTNKELERKAKMIQYGLVGEKNIRFELANSHMPSYVLHDIYLEDGDLNAQIDYIIIARKKTYFIECKNLIGDITIDNNGSFTRTYMIGNHKIKEGIYSPITQNQRHLDLYKSICMKEKGTLSKLAFAKYFDDFNRSIVVLANAKSTLNDRYAPKDIRKKVIRADQLIDYIKREEASSKDLSSSDKEMKERADRIILKHKVKEMPISNSIDNAVQADPEQEVPNSSKDYDKLIETLKKYRLDKSRALQIKPYFIFNNAEMEDLIKANPKNKEEFIKIKGFSEKKYEQYGEEIINIIKGEINDEK